MAYEKHTWTNVHGETPITAEKLNEMEQGIEDAGKTGGVEVGAVIGWTGEGTPEGYDEVKIGYSTEEILTGETWKDGKPIYRKVIQSTMSKSGQKQNIYFPNDVDVMLPIEGFVLQSATGGVNLSLPYVASNMSIYVYYDRAEQLVIIENTGVTFLNDAPTYLICKYTKTTDTGNFKYIEKKAVTELEAITGSIVDGTNIDDKVHNTYSANTIDNLVTTTTNGNGKAIKFPDGTMICRGTITISSTTFNAWGQMYGGTFTVNHAFPVEFIETPCISLTPFNLGAIYEHQVTASQITTVSIMRPTSSTGAVSIDYIAIGRWK